MREKEIPGKEDEVEEDFTSGAFIDSKNCIYCEEDKEEIMKAVFKDTEE